MTTKLLVFHKEARQSFSSVEVQLAANSRDINCVNVGAFHSRLKVVTLKVFFLESLNTGTGTNIIIENYLMSFHRSG